MEYIVYLLVLFVSGSFLLKVSFYPLWGKVAVAVAGALFMGLVTPWITELPPTWMTRFITYRPQLLDLSVCITLEAAIMIGFCFSRVAASFRTESLFARSGSFGCRLRCGRGQEADAGAIVAVGTAFRGQPVCPYPYNHTHWLLIIIQYGNDIKHTLLDF